VIDLFEVTSLRVNFLMAVTLSKRVWH